MATLVSDNEDSGTVQLDVRMEYLVRCTLYAVCSIIEVERPGNSAWGFKLAISVYT
jgi:hypothetical protein